MKEPLYSSQPRHLASLVSPLGPVGGFDSRPHPSHISPTLIHRELLSSQDRMNVLRVSCDFRRGQDGAQAPLSLAVGRLSILCVVAGLRELGTLVNVSFHVEHL